MKLNHYQLVTTCLAINKGNIFTNTKIKPLNDPLVLRETLQQYHPLFIEGHSSDKRNASDVADAVVLGIRRHWEQHNASKPVLLVTQGDPLTETGISAVTRFVAKQLEVPRCLVCLDDTIDPNHSKLADRYGAIYEMKYSQLVSLIDEQVDGLSRRIEAGVDRSLAAKNVKREQQGKGKLAAWYKDYALLQEITKVAFKMVTGDVTVAHTHATGDIRDFSVTSFYQVGLDLGLICEEDMVYYNSSR